MFLSRGNAAFDDFYIKLTTSPFLDSCSLVEYRALQKELDERNSQRDELLYNIKVTRAIANLISMRLSCIA